MLMKSYISYLKFDYELDEIRFGIQHFLKTSKRSVDANIKFWSSYLQFSPLENLRIELHELGGPFNEGAEVLANFIYSRRAAFPVEPPEGSIQAFDFEYKHQDHSLSHFKDFVFRRIINAYIARMEYYHSLYFSIVQSSCFGKSRLVLEAGKRDLNVTYCCLRDWYSNGFPMTNQDVFEFFQKSPSIKKLELFIMTTFYVASSYSLNFPIDTRTPPLSHLDNPLEPVKFTTFWKNVFQVMNECTEDDLSMFNSINAFWNLFQTQNEKESAEKSFIVNKFDGSNAIQQGLSHLLIVFDEANFLVERKTESSRHLFRDLRKAHQNLNPSTCVLVFIDTLSSISKFQPSQINDPSYRKVNSKFDLLPPYYEVLTADPDPEPLNESLKGIQRLRKIFSYGRPSWYAMFFAPKYHSFGSLKLSEILNFVKKKLSYRFIVENLTDEAKIAILSIRFGILRVMDHTLASQLMASYMGTGVFISQDRHRIAVEYIPEPVLAEAACQLLHGRQKGLSKSTSFSWEYVFDPQFISACLLEFAKKCLCGIVDAGDLGELLSRVILSLAFDYVHLVYIPEKISKLEGRKSFQKAKNETRDFPNAKRAKLDSVTNAMEMDNYLLSDNQQPDKVRASPMLRDIEPPKDKEKLELKEPAKKTESTPIDNEKPVDKEKLDNGISETEPKPASIGIGHDSYFSDPITLGDFLHVLFPMKYQKNWLKELKPEGTTNFFEFHKINQDDLDNFTVCFTSWIALEKTNAESFSQQNLKYYYDRCIAIILPPGHKGTDLIIPMRNKKTLKYSYITNQIKNKQKYDVSRYDAAGSALKPANYFSPPSLNDKYIGIYMEVDCKETDCKPDIEKVKELVDNCPRHLMLLGTPQLFLSNDTLKDTFRFIQKSTISNVESYIRAENLNRMNTVTYKFSKRYCCNCLITNFVNNQCGCRKYSLNCFDSCHPSIKSCSNLNNEPQEL